MKKITIVNQDSGYLMVDLANSFCSNGFDTSIIAGRIVIRETELNPVIRVTKIKRYDRSSNFSKILSWILGTLQILFLVVFKYRKSHLFIVSNPPLAPLLPLLIRNEFSIMVFDVYPDVITESGILKNKSVIIKLWSLANSRVYKKAKILYTLTEGMKKALSQYVNKEKIKIIPLWTSNSFLKPLAKDENPFIKRNDLQGKFIILYSGNFGNSHNIEIIVDIASHVKDEKIVFVLIGDGPSKNQIIQKITGMHLINCLVLPLQDVSVLPYSLSSADLSIVTLNKTEKQIAVPSKIFNYMAVGSPVLCITGKGSDLDNMIGEYKIGKSFEFHQINEIIDFIDEVINNPDLQKFYAQNSIIASTYHTSKNADLIVQDYV